LPFLQRDARKETGNLIDQSALLSLPKTAQQGTLQKALGDVCSDSPNYSGFSPANTESNSLALVPFASKPTGSDGPVGFFDPEGFSRKDDYFRIEFYFELKHLALALFASVALALC
jgi:hypothetical protein